MTSPKKLLIDINSVVPYFVSGKVNGIGRTTRELLMALAQEECIPFEIILYSQNMKGIGGRNLQLPFKCKHLYFPHRENYDKLLAKFPIKDWFTGYDIMHIPHNFEYVRHPEQCIVTLHDMILFTCPDEFSFDSIEYSRKIVPPFMRKVKSVITCSESSKNDIIKYMDINPDKIYVTYWGIDHSKFRRLNKCAIDRINLFERYGIKKPYLFSVSCGIGRKNTIELLKAYSLLLKNQPKNDMVIVWKTITHEAMQIVKKSNGRIHVLQDISDEDLVQLYNYATATYYPSKYEGFGLPILESMACGTPVVTGRNSSLQEIGSDIAIYVQSEDAQGILEIMENMENAVYDMQSLSNLGINHALQFTWGNCAKKTLSVYNDCLFNT